MLSAVARLRVALALAAGRPLPCWALDRLVAAALAAVREPEAFAPAGAEPVAGASLDHEARRAVQLLRFRAQAQRAARETEYYGALFSQLGLDPTKLSWEEIARILPTPKTALREDPDAFVRQGSRPILRAATTGTTGKPTQVCFSAGELRTMVALAALGSLLHGQLAPDDVVVMATSSRATLGNLRLAGACARIGALLRPVGIVEPELTLALLTEPLRLPGLRPKASVLSTYPSYLGQLVEVGLHLGHSPADFGLRRIALGGEIVTEGLLRRARALFGDDVTFDTGYAMTETFPAAGQPCEAGHLHVDPSRALVELLDPDSDAPCGPGAVGTLVVTPLPPFRETTLLLRYDTEDLAQVPAEAPTCSLAHLPATSQLLGKRRLAVRHKGGWTYPRHVLEALESVDAVPLPARFGLSPAPDGVAIEVVTSSRQPGARRAIEQSLAASGVPVTDLRLITDPIELRRPYPLRCDLKELGFTPPPPATTLNVQVA